MNTAVPHTKTIEDLKSLNKKYELLSPIQRIRELYEDFGKDNILLTSSFGTSSIILLYMYHVVNSDQPIHFLETTYHFKETMQYKTLLTNLFNLNVVMLKPAEWENDFTKKDETWKKDPDLCCSINNVKPLNSKKQN